MTDSNILFINGFLVEQLCSVALEEIRSNPSFPYRTGNLRQHATYVGTNSMEIVFDEVKAPYIKYLEYGTAKSTKHVGFIERAVEDACNGIARVINGQIII